MGHATSKKARTGNGVYGLDEHDLINPPDYLSCVYFFRFG